jgi:Bacterial dnaA protein helix-turn-helix
MTPLQIELDDARKARLARFNAAVFRAQHPIPIPLKPERDVLQVSSPSQAPQEALTPLLLLLFIFLVKAQLFHTDRKRSFARIEAIQRVVADYYGLSFIDLLSHRRTTKLVRPRQIAMYLTKKLTLKSLPEIGRRFRGRDHTTVLHGIKRITELIEHDADLAHDVDELEALLTPADKAAE